MSEMLLWPVFSPTRSTFTCLKLKIMAKLIVFFKSSIALWIINQRYESEVILVQ